MCAPLLMILMLAAPITQASEPKSRIRYAEPIQIQTSKLPSSARAQSADTPALLAFDAYGRRFELELESNERLLRRLAPSRRAELPPHGIYRGRLTGLPGSWVRLTRLPDGIYGAIWDGSEFYSIAPAHALAAFMGGITPPTSDRALIYRASDVDVLTGARFCAAVDRRAPSTKTVSGLDQYQALLSELPRAASTADAIAMLELEVAMIGDFEFFSQEADPLGELLDRLNVVDGIFSEQVGVAIAATELRVFDDPGDPFMTTNAGTLLDEVGSYRVATPLIAAAGLAHLVTGRDLDGATVGIAYIAGVCEAEFGVSLSERFTDPLLSALIAAHEFGHNLGAPHDGVAGPCATTAFGLLMSPELNGSRTFSQCSLNQMAPVVAASSCIRTRKYVDIAIEIPRTAYTGHARAPETIQFDVVNTGTQAAAGAIASIDLDHSLTPTSISAEGGSCTVEFEDLTCRLDEIPADARRRVRFDVTALGPGSTSNSITVAINDDVDQANNNGAFRFDVAAATDASIVAEAPQNLTVLSGDEFQISYRVAVTGIEALGDATVRTTGANFVVLAATPQSGTCSISSSIATCSLGRLEVGSTRRVTLRVRAGRAGDRQLQHVLEGNIDDTAGNNLAAHNIRVNPLVDLVVDADSSTIRVQKGETFARRFVVRSIGPREARGASFSVHWPNDVVEVTGIDAQDATCTTQPGGAIYQCSFAAPIESGGSRQVDVAFRAIGVDIRSITGSVFAPENQHFSGPLSTSVEIRVEVRESADVRLESVDVRGQFESRPFFVEWRVQSIGVTSAQNAGLTLTLPSGVTALSATPSSGTCTLATSSVRCSLGALDVDHAATVSFGLQGDRPGEFVLTAEAAASNDGDATNNLDTVNLTLFPNVDVRVDAPSPLERIKLGSRTPYPVQVRTASQPVSNVQVRIARSNLDVSVRSVSQGSCSPGTDAIDCALGEMSANATVQIELEMQGLEPGSAQIIVHVRGDLDVDSSNDTNGESLVVVPLGSATIEMGPASRTRVGETFDSPEITVRALAQTDAVRVRITVPAELIIESVAQDAGPCSVSNRTVDCDFGDLQAADRRSTFMRLRATEAGSFAIAAEVTPLDDSDHSDNVASATINVDAAAAPQPDTPASSGGGGGSLDWMALMFGAAGVGLRRRRWPPTATFRAGQVHSGRCPDGSAL